MRDIKKQILKNQITPLTIEKEIKKKNTKIEDIKMVRVKMRNDGLVFAELYKENLEKILIDEFIDLEDLKNCLTFLKRFTIMNKKAEKIYKGLLKFGVEKREF